MKRSGQILVVSHCLLNANARIIPSAMYEGVMRDALFPFIELGVGMVQLPCPELSYLGMNRWSMSRKQYDHPNYRRHCREILKTSLDHIEAFHQQEYEFLGVVGVNGSPNCGIDRTFEGFEGGEITSAEDIQKQLENLSFVEGRGVFMGVLAEMLKERNISIRFMGVNDEDPACLICE